MLRLETAVTNKVARLRAAATTSAKTKTRDLVFMFLTPGDQIPGVVIQRCRIRFAVVPDVAAKAAVVTAHAGVFSHCPDAQRRAGWQNAAQGAALIAFLGHQYPAVYILVGAAHILNVNKLILLVHPGNDDLSRRLRWRLCRCRLLGWCRRFGGRDGCQR